MFFRNLLLFRIDPGFSFDALEGALDDARLKPIGPLEMSTRGFVSPFGREEEVLVHRVNGGLWLVLGGEDKLLPAAVVNEAAAKKVDEIEAREGRRLGARARKRVKEELLHELLPRAFTKPVRVNAHIDTTTGVVMVDSSSRKAAEAFISELRKALGSFPAVPVNAEVAPRSVLTGWVSGDALPDGLVLGDEAELRDPVDKGSVAKLQRHQLEGDEVSKHLEAGKQCARLALTLDDHLSFVVGDDLVVRKLKFLNGAVESLEGTERDSARAELDARYALMVGELRRLFHVLEPAFKISPVAP